jgi:class 3 adenylate cyclase
MSDLPDDLAKKIKRKIDRARSADNVAHESWDEVIEVFEEAAKKVTLRGKTKSNPHDESYKRFGKRRIAIMLFMDIVGYSKLDSDSKQQRAISDLNKIVRRALRSASCDMDDVICLPTGDGMCLCFTDPEVPLPVAGKIQSALLAEAGSKMKLRMGIHSGGVVQVKDLKGWFNLAGDAINMTQRAMDYGDEWHILCTAEAYKLLERIHGVKDSLNLLGHCEVKHGTMLELYNYFCDTKKIGNPALPKKAATTAAGKQKSGSRKSASVAGN